MASLFTRMMLSLREWWLAKQRAECIDEEQWLQEYCCVPADESTAFLPYDLITPCEDPALRLQDLGEFLAAMREPAHAADQLYLGVDVARKTDLCVLDVGQKLGDGRERRVVTQRVLSRRRVGGEKRPAGIRGGFPTRRRVERDRGRVVEGDRSTVHDWLRFSRRL